MCLYGYQSTGSVYIALPPRVKVDPKKDQLIVSGGRVPKDVRYKWGTEFNMKVEVPTPVAM